jgi:hypothetical protein
VTHQGSLAADTEGTVALVVLDETLRVACDDPFLSEVLGVLGRTADPRSFYVRRCSRCAGVLPAFARLGPLRSGP